MVAYLWIAPVVIVLIVNAFFGYKNNTESGMKWFWFMWISSIVPVWPIVSKISKNLLFDSLLFDILVLLVYTSATIVFMKERIIMTPIKITAILMIVTGLILLKTN